MFFFPLLIASGLCWTVTYLLIIRRSLLDRTYGMPLAALCANIAWEFLFAFAHPSPGVQRIVNIVWFLLDAVIFYTLLRYGPKEFVRLSRAAFYAVVALSLATALGGVAVVSGQFDHWQGIYAAFGQNLMMSALFVAMLYQRGSLRGQSAAIALFKLLGTACASLEFFLYASPAYRNPLLWFLYVAIFVFDAIYLAACVAMGRRGSAAVAASIGAAV